MVWYGTSFDDLSDLWVSDRDFKLAVFFEIESKTVLSHNN